MWFLHFVNNTLLHVERYAVGTTISISLTHYCTVEPH